MKYCPLIIQILSIISVRCIPLSLRSKTRRRGALLLPTFVLWFAPVYWEGRQLLIHKSDNFHIHITYFPFLSSNIPSLPAYDTHPISRGFLLWIFYSESDATFQFSDRDMSRNVRSRFSGNSIVDERSYQTIWSPLLPNATRRSGGGAYFVTSPIDQTLQDCDHVNWTLLPN